MTKNIRRNLFKGIAGSIPVIWAKPLVQTAIIPAHATTSEPDGNFGLTHLSASSDDPLNILELLIPTAHAAKFCKLEAICTTLRGGVVTVFASISGDKGCFRCISGSGMVGDTVTLLPTDEGCKASKCTDPTIEIESLTGIFPKRILNLKVGDQESTPCTETSSDCDCDALDDNK